MAGPIGIMAHGHGCGSLGEFMRAWRARSEHCSSKQTRQSGLAGGEEGGAVDESRCLCVEASWGRGRVGELSGEAPGGAERAPPTVVTLRDLWASLNITVCDAAWLLRPHSNPSPFWFGAQ